MDGLYDIFRGDEKIGRVQVRREGLYYRFQCCCDLTGEVMYRLIVTCGEKTEKLGIPVPEGDGFRLDTRLPVSRFRAGKPIFRAVLRREQLKQGMWVPISPEAPFAYISRLENAVTQRRNDELGILIREEDPSEVPQDSGQIRRHPHE